MSPKARILIVEDDTSIATALALNLKLDGYVSEVASDGEQGLSMALSDEFDLILLDIGLPKKDGVSLLTDLRAADNHTPVVVLSALGGEYDKVAALRLGADDYVTKPFALAELSARLDAVLRRAGPRRPQPRISAFGDVEIDYDTRSVVRGGAPRKLTHLEFELLAFFADKPKQVFSRREILREVWATTGSPRTVDNFVGQLRSKLEQDPENPVHFVTVRGSGYRFDP